MKARYVIVMGLAVLATSCSTSCDGDSATFNANNCQPDFTSKQPSAGRTTIRRRSRHSTTPARGTDVRGYVIPEPEYRSCCSRAPTRTGIIQVDRPASLRDQRPPVACGDACVYNQFSTEQLLRRRQFPDARRRHLQSNHNCLRRPDPTAYERTPVLCVKQQPGTSLPPLELRQAWGDHQRICP